VGDADGAPPGVAELAAGTAWCFPLGEPADAVGVLVIGDGGQDRLPYDVAALAADLACRIGLALARVGPAARPGAGQADNGQARSGEAGTGQPGPDQAGAYQAGAGEAGAGEAGAGEAGAGEPGAGEAGADSLGTAKGGTGSIDPARLVAHNS
jgi:hypothetical protein